MSYFSNYSFKFVSKISLVFIVGWKNDGNFWNFENIFNTNFKVKGLKRNISKDNDYFETWGKG